MSKNKSPKQNNQRSNSLNPNNPAHKAGQDNKANQQNPNHQPTNPPAEKTDGKAADTKQP